MILTHNKEYYIGLEVHWFYIPAKLSIVKLFEVEPIKLSLFLISS